MYICTYLYSYTYIHTYVYTYVYKCFFICMYVHIYLTVYVWMYLNSLITYANNTQILLCVLQGFLTKDSARTVIWVLTHIFKHHPSIQKSFRDIGKSRSRMLQPDRPIVERDSCRDLHRPLSFILRAVWNKKISLCSRHNFFLTWDIKENQSQNIDSAAFTRKCCSWFGPLPVAEVRAPLAIVCLMQVSGQAVCTVCHVDAAGKRGDGKAHGRNVTCTLSNLCVCCPASQTVWGADLGHQH